MLTVLADCYVIHSQWHCGCGDIWSSLHLLMYRPDSALVCSQQCLGYSVKRTQRNSHAQSYMHPGVLGTIQIRAGSLVYRTGCERGRAVRGRSVLWILMSGRVVGMEWNNRASLCSTLHPSHTQRGKESFSQSLSPLPPAVPGTGPSSSSSSSSANLAKPMWAADYSWFHARLSPGVTVWSILSHLNEEVLHSFLTQNV